MAVFIFYIWQMKLKWYILIFAFALLGIASQHQMCLPNQEIVLRFTNGEVTSDEVQVAINNVKKQLLSIGVSNIKVQEQEDRSLKITYYSDIDVAGIKKIFSTEKNIKLGYVSKSQNKKHSKSSSNDNRTLYDLDIFEIKKQDAGFDLSGKYATGLKFEKNRFFNPFIHGNLIPLYTDLLSNQNTDDNFHVYIAVVIHNPSYKIPDGRAGPNISGIKNLS
jgi:hypothetical protein